MEDGYKLTETEETYGEALEILAKYYKAINKGPSYKRPETLYTSLKGVFKGEDHLRFFDHRFIAIWVLPIALTGIVFEVLFISPTKSTFPFN